MLWVGSVHSRIETRTGISSFIALMPLNAELFSVAARKLRTITADQEHIDRVTRGGCLLSGRSKPNLQPRCREISIITTQ